MGSPNTKIYSHDELFNLENAHLSEYIIKLVERKDRINLINALEQLKHREKKVDKYFKNKTLLQWTLSSDFSQKNKINMLKFLMENYNFDINKASINGQIGNILVQNSECICEELVDLMLMFNIDLNNERESYINNKLYRCTIIDELMMNKRKNIELISYLKGKGACAKRR